MSHCGACQACCTIMRVNDKPARERCPHQCATGCAIYDMRPTVCREWSCMWLYTQGDAVAGVKPMPSALRPDRSGVVLEPNNAGNIVAHCAKPNSWRVEPMRSWLLDVASRTNILLEFGDDTPLLLHADGSTEPLDWTGGISAEGNREYRRRRV